MTDLRLTAIAIAIILPLSMLLYSNSRISDFKEALRAEMQANRAVMQTDNPKYASTSPNASTPSTESSISSCRPARNRTQ